ncbi:uncharacterized protein BO97DRAFT_472760 [Aspergillus homomorphus CBS 101889]|uniref:Ribonuclease H-like protein n=1 Tax=Aspergillus homomorphus (strain CBS 101889) TaxID=1450537 RepID=A0A395HNE8_ASPHC|nr:ribonuclease H-like protein [Aspergillus homomorphus CBS 101889]RAL09009.1 ribonuclease H-like protein [Aspergillus homomorphus CBS 101889]
MRTTAPLRQCASTILRTLKAAQLQRIAQSTGIKSSGTKPVIVDRLETELAQCEYSALLSPPPQGVAAQPRRMSILSIDMGIRNLAFAHLLVSPPSPAPSIPGNPPPKPQITLNAWRRLSIPELDNQTSWTSPPPLSPGSDTHPSPKPENQEEDPFSPARYARHAYTLLITLLTLYRPTHVLIERQRFRSGGAAAVQEWTIRVGVFEGMLYAVLYALRRERERGGSAAAVVVPRVWGVEPARVSRFCLAESPPKKKRKSTREVKNMKMDRVGNWLRNATSLLHRGRQGRLAVADEAELHSWVEAYLAKWEGKQGARQRTTPPDGGAAAPDIGKLDDLADCLVQGVTWLEWQVMRHRLVADPGLLAKV